MDNNDISQSAYVEFENREDLEEALFNCNGSVILNKVIKVEIYKKPQFKTNRPIWESEEYNKNHYFQNTEQN